MLAAIQVGQKLGDGEGFTISKVQLARLGKVSSDAMSLLYEMYSKVDKYAKPGSPIRTAAAVDNAAEANDDIGAAHGPITVTPDILAEAEAVLSPKIGERPDGDSKSRDVMAWEIRRRTLLNKVLQRSMNELNGTDVKKALQLSINKFNTEIAELSMELHELDDEDSDGDGSPSSSQNRDDYVGPGGREENPGAGGAGSNTGGGQDGGGQDGENGGAGEEGRPGKRKKPEEAPQSAKKPKMGNH